MTENEKEDWERVAYRMDAEGFNYCFDGYSDWNEIKDETFHELRENYLKSMNKLREYIMEKVDYECEN